MSATLSVRRKCCVPLTSFFVVVGLVACLGDHPPQRHVKVEMTLSKKSFCLGEDVPVLVFAVNTGKSSVPVALEERARGRDSTHLELRDGMGEKVDYIGWHENVASPGERFVPVPPGKRATRRLNLAKLYSLDRPGVYKVRTYATVGRRRIFTEWQSFRVIAGKEVFRKDVKFIRARPEGPKAEHASIVVYALGKFHVAYYIRTVEKDGKKTTVYRRMTEVEAARKPQVLKDADGEVHILLAQRPLTKEEIEKRFKGFPISYKEHTELRFYSWYKTRASDGQLTKGRRVGVNKHEKKEETPYLRLIKPKAGPVVLHLFSPKGENLGVYTSPGQATKQVPTSSPASKDATSRGAGKKTPIPQFPKRSNVGRKITLSCSDQRSMSVVRQIVDQLQSKVKGTYFIPSVNRNASIGWFADGNCDVLAYRAPPTERESAMLSRLFPPKRRQVESFVIGREIVVVIANQTKTIRALSTAQMAKVFGVPGKGMKWKELGDAGETVAVYAEGKKARSRIIVRNTCMRYRKNFEGGYYSGRHPYRDDLQQCSDAQDVVSKVRNHRDGIGFFLYDGKPIKGVNILAVGKTDKGPFVKPKLGPWIQEDYPLTEPLILHLHPKAPPLAKKFCQFAVGPGHHPQNLYTPLAAVEQAIDKEIG